MHHGVFFSSLLQMSSFGGLFFLSPAVASLRPSVARPSRGKSLRSQHSSFLVAPDDIWRSFLQSALACVVSDDIVRHEGKHVVL